MYFRTLVVAAVIGLMLTGSGYAACDQNALNFYPSWPKNEKGTSQQAANAPTDAATDTGQAAKGPTQQVEVKGSGPNKACN